MKKNKYLLLNKVNKSENLLISIVTIVYNGVNEIEDTIKSVLSQTYKNIEYIIIDGDSNDGTVDIISKYQNEISYWQSEKDNGLYDAMNKGNNIANGDYIIFLNCGDKFSDNTVIDRLFKDILTNEYSLITGKTKVFYKKIDLGIVNPLFLNQNKENTISFSHQATFINKSIYKYYQYNTLFKISGDKEYWNRIKKDVNFTVKFSNINVADFELGGVSNNHKNVLNRRTEDFFIEYLNEGIDFRKFIKLFFLTLISHLVTLNEHIYFNKIYVLMHKFKNRKYMHRTSNVLR